MAENLNELFEEDREDGMSPDFYKIYKEELKLISPCGDRELEQLSESAAVGNKAAKKRLVEGNLHRVVSIAEEYRDAAIPMSDIVQEANMALLLFAEDYEGGDFRVLMEERIRAALDEALDLQDREMRIEEEMAARVNVLNDISTGMANELGREATVEELAERMKMTADEIRDIMKLTLDAMSVSGE